jgi:hypothetical protein
MKMGQTLAICLAALAGAACGADPNQWPGE